MAQDTVTIAIANCAVSLRIPHKSVRDRVRLRYRGYCVRDRIPQLVLECSFSNKLSGGGERPTLVRSVDGAWRARRRDFDCRWCNGAGEATLVPSVYAIDALLRVLFSVCLPRQDALLVHGSAIVTRCTNTGLVFIGPSGSGKTTAARLCRSRFVLNDEICALTIDKEGSVRVSGTPFWGEMGTGPAHPQLHRLGMLLTLRKAAQLRLVPLTHGDALGRLLRCVCLFGRDEGLVGQALQITSRMVLSAQTQVRELQFPRSPFDPAGWMECGAGASEGESI